MNGIYQCQMCQDSGRISGTRGEAIACQNCIQGAEYARQLNRSTTSARPGLPRDRLPRLAAKTRGSDALSPTEIAFLLKTLLYGGVATAVFLLCRADRGERGVPQVSESDASEADRAAEYSTWEPEK
jgi:hypothetical protein